ncbi:CLUMA_CG002949, isoform A [Clunio marinus]|uniref:CLUMA_CG002949, isoform A n=1 Tax=Clunio marinus TaxID=568069 RepID=A0A1J1HMB8_9DIPT|nr:CLUMA_CG002949, isoform A [Clunio marinus]
MCFIFDRCKACVNCLLLDSYFFLVFILRGVTNVSSWSAW